MGSSDKNTCRQQATRCVKFYSKLLDLFIFYVYLCTVQHKILYIGFEINVILHYYN